MTSASSAVVLVVIVGPQASGKSTLAVALAAELRERGERVALVELDQIAGMALPTLPDWDIAHSIFETVVAAWTTAGMTCVIAEGGGSAHEVSRLLGTAPDDAITITVALTAPFDVAFDRARADPTRGISRKHAFLSRRYEEWQHELGRIPADVVIDTARITLDDGVALVRRAIDTTRDADRRPEAHPRDL